MSFKKIFLEPYTFICSNLILGIFLILGKKLQCKLDSSLKVFISIPTNCSFKCQNKTNLKANPEIKAQKIDIRKLLVSMKAFKEISIN